MKEKIRKLMAGRYGLDQLNEALILSALAFMVISMFLKSTPLKTVGLLLLVLCYVRMFSRNIGKRYDENIKFLNYRDKIMKYISAKKEYIKQLRVYHIYKCPNCKQKIRVPRGKGKISITCPKCKTEFVKRS